MKVDGVIAGKIGRGLVVLVGVKSGDTNREAMLLADKVCKLRVFDDTNGKMNLNVTEAGGELLVISQFTLYGDTSSGNRPSYSSAARAEEAEPLYKEFIKYCAGKGLFVATGVFGADMKVLLENDGPVTLLCSTENKS